MKTIKISDETFDAICDVLVGEINRNAMSVEILSRTRGIDHETVQELIAETDRLDALETEFRAAGTTPPQSQG